MSVTGRGSLVTLRAASAVGIAAAVVLMLGSLRGTFQTPIAAANTDSLTPGPASIDTSTGDTIGRRALSVYMGSVDPPPATDPDLDALARDQLRAAIQLSLDTGDLGPRLVHPTADVLVRVGAVSTSELDSRANVFPLDGPESTVSVGSAGGEALLAGAGSDRYLAEVAAVAWRDPSIADASDELSAVYGSVPATVDDLNAAAARRWIHQENRDRQQSNFPGHLLARRDPVLDREAENTMRRKLGEPVLPSVVDPNGQVALDKKTHFTAYACSPNCEPFWTIPDRAVDVIRQAPVEDALARSVSRPELFDFQRYNRQLTWAVQLPRLPHYWNSYLLFGIATRVHPDQEVADGRAAARGAVEALAPGGADRWDPRELRVDMVVIAYDPWPTDWNRTS